MFFHLFSENFQNVLGHCVSDTALILVNPVYKESRFSSEQTRIKLVPNSSVIPNNLFKMSSPTYIYIYIMSNRDCIPAEDKLIKHESTA